MNKIEKLLKELCPNGVEYKKLNEVCDIVKGKQLNKDKLFKEGPYAVINGGINPSGYWEEYNFNEDAITISQGGASAGYVQWQENKFWAGAHCYVLINPNSKLIYRFIYHVVKMNENKYMESQLGAGIPSLSSKDLGNTEIPIPPLEIQKEIVNVLDKMVFLERELERELDKRKTQYSYYRDKLLKPEVDVQIVKLKDIATLFFRGNGIKREHVKECGIPCVRYGEIYTKYNIWFDKCISHTDLSLIDNPKYIEYGDVLFAITGESVIDIGKTVAYIGNEKCLVGGDILVMRHKQNPKYLSYALSTTSAIEQKGKGKIKSKVVHTNADSIGNIEIPLPSLEIQQKIVDVLDNFEKYCSDLNIGLPAETSRLKDNNLFL